MFALFVQSTVLAQKWRERPCVHSVRRQDFRFTPADCTTYRAPEQNL